MLTHHSLVIDRPEQQGRSDGQPRERAHDTASTQPQKYSSGELRKKRYGLAEEDDLMYRRNIFIIIFFY